VRWLQAALQEAIARDQLAQWPPRDECSRFGLKALEQYAARADVPAVLASPLRDAAGVVRGAWLIAGDIESVTGEEAQSLLSNSGPHVASALRLLMRARPGWIGELLLSITGMLRLRRGRAILAAALVMMAAMFIPVPHRIRCSCQLEPVTRRFVAAPFDGLLRETCVRPGDLVTQNQLLARMDESEVRWELAAVQADRFRASKELAGQVATHQPGEAEVTRHEVQRLQFREQLLQSRDQNLAVRSPVDGVIVSGDLQDAEGMPLKVGELLFEVAPLGELDVELSVAEDDLPYIRDGMPVRVTLDAFPMRTFESKIERIHPRAEIRDGENVFVAQVRLSNPQRTLHPGMRGYARVLAGKAALGWILFRRPLAASWEWLGW
jgi:multidrug efflux pump subunit AcrA (membrane-fusion protein)